MLVAIKRSDNGVSIMKVHKPLEGMTQEQAIAREIAEWERVVSQQFGWTAIGWRIVQESELHYQSKGKRFRAAWRFAGSIDGPIVVGLGEARKERRQELEAHREKVLARLRDKIDEAEDAGQTARVANLKAKRKNLRALDLAAKVLEVATVEALDTFTPVEFAEP